MNPKVSLIASSVRPQLYDDFFKSLEGTSVEYEVVFAGHSPSNEVNAYFYHRLDGTTLEIIRDKGNFHYIETKKIKPSQCYEITRRHAKGEVIVWTCDDAEFVNDIIGKAYRYWKSQENEKLILSMQTREYYLERPDDKGSGFCDMYQHTFTGRKGAPLMAPLAMISREYVEKFGGIDRRYVCGQWDNSILMDAYADGAKVEVFGDKDTHIAIDHVGKFEKLTGKKGFKEHAKRPFGTGYHHDRSILERTWGRKGDKVRQDDFQPFIEDNILIQSQSTKGIWD